MTPAAPRAPGPAPRCDGRPEPSAAPDQVAAGGAPPPLGILGAVLEGKALDWLDQASDFDRRTLAARLEFSVRHRPLARQSLRDLADLVARFTR